MNQCQPVWIYHELQDSLLCGQHALNNLIQQENFFHPGQLAEIAHQLDAEERIYMGGMLSGPSGNVDPGGNFSIQVITNALSNIGIELTVWNLERSGMNLEHEIGFIVNRDDHWFSIRKINDKWWNLNSSLKKPEYISDFYLGAFLTQLASDGYSVFVARGDFPQVYVDANSGGRYWHRESDLIKNDTVSAADKFTGKGRKLGSSALNQEDDDDEQLAQAIALSMADNNAACVDNDPEMTEKEKIRAKRLAAMGR